MGMGHNQQKLCILSGDFQITIKRNNVEVNSHSSIEN